MLIKHKTSPFSSLQLNRKAILPVIFIHSFIFLLLGLFALVYFSYGINPENLIYASCILLLLLVIWLIWSWKKAVNSLFDPYAIFLAAAAIFNGGLAFLEIFHLNENGILSNSILYDTFPPEIMLKSIFLVILGLAAFHLGALIAAAICMNKISENKPEDKCLQPSQSDMRLVGWILLFISIIPLFLISKNSIDIAISFGYSVLFQQESATGVYAIPRALATFFVPGALFLLAGSRDCKRGVIISSTLILAYSAIELIIGKRSYAIMALIAYVWLFHHLIKPIPKSILISGGAFVVFIISPIVKVIRNIPSWERFSISSVISSLSLISSPLVATISELGSTMRTISYTIYMVPAFRSFDMGIGYLYSLLAVIPNIFWDIHPVISYGTPSDWLVQEVNFYVLESGGRLGYSFIAESYLNFGWFGIIFLAVVGFFIAMLVLWAMKSKEPAKMAMLASFTSFFLFYARSELYTILRFLVWYSFFPYIGVYIIRWFKAGLARGKT